MKKSTIVAIMALLLVSSVFAQEGITGDFKRSMDGYRMHAEGQRQMHTGFVLLVGLFFVGLIMLVWLLVIKLWKSTFSKK